MATSSIDEYVGLKLKIRRSALGITQNELGDMAGITFQQIQKYEKGFNRIGAGRLYQFANILNVPINYFFDGYNDKSFKSRLKDANKFRYDGKSNNEDLFDKDTITLLKFFSRIENKKTRSSIINLAKSLASENEILLNKKEKKK